MRPFVRFTMSRMTIKNDDYFVEVKRLLLGGNVVTVPVKGSSMSPFIVEGRDRVVIEGIETATPENDSRRRAEVGDIVLFQTDGKYYLHRILRISDGVVETQGDGILHSKEYCQKNDIFGRVTTILKDGERPVSVDAPLHKALVRLWLILHPFRRILLWIWRKTQRRSYIYLKF